MTARSSMARSSMARLSIALAVCAMVLAACSGIPTSSSPEVVRTVTRGVATPAAPAPSPTQGSDPHLIVADFLGANVSEDAHHTGARNFLTADTARKWTDTIVKVVGTYQVGVFDPTTKSVVVTADEVLGTIDQRGVYTPSLQSSSNSTAPPTFTFGMQRVSGQWRIQTLANVVIVDRADFMANYHARPIYLFDQQQKHLVPDLRYSALTDQPLSTWLLDQLGNPPRTELQQAVTSDLPTQTTHATVTVGSPIVVNLPGSNQLDSATKQRLAAQLAFTFADTVPFSSAVVLDDGNRQVSVPGITAPYTSDEFTAFAPPSTVPPAYYVNAGAVMSGDRNAPIAGPLGSGNYGFTSVALASRAGSILVAGTTGNSGAEHLVVGTTTTAPVQTQVPASPLSRPVWAPDLSEVWVASGSNLWRLSAPGGKPAAAPVAVSATLETGLAVAGTIGAVSFAPDGVRIALVIAAPATGGQPATSQLYIGSVVRSGQDASVVSLEAVTPPSVMLTDVAWNDSTTLYACGPGGIWSVLVDGSLLTQRSVQGLPGTPTTIAAAPFAVTWVSADQSVWVQSTSVWSEPDPKGVTALGDAPTYLE